MRPERHDIAAPEPPPNARWLNGEPKAMSALTAHGPVLVHFFDFAQLNCVRSLPYVAEWERRYSPVGLTTLGIHSPRHPFTGEPEALAAALDRLGIAHPVADDSSYSIWHDYGCEGWPSLFLWGRGGALRWFHFGEGEYEATERAIQEELRATNGAASLPEPMAPLRASDAPGALVIAPTEELLPGGSLGEPWSPSSSEPALEVDYAAGGAYATLDGQGELGVAVDGEERSIAFESPGLSELAEHPHHSEHRLRVEPGPGVRVWSVSFAPGVPDAAPQT